MKLLLALFLCSVISADTWPCWSVLTTGPVLSPPAQNLCAPKTVAGGQYTQSGAYSLQLYNSQIPGNQGPPVPVNVSGTGTCTSSASPFPNGYPKWGPTTMQQVGSVLNWSTMIANTIPTYFTVLGVQVIYNYVQSAPTLAGLTPFAAAPCTCFPTDCCNPAIGTACQTTCPVRGCQSCHGDIAGQPESTCTPILMDIAGTGFNLSSQQDGVWYDVFGNGNMLRVAWPTVESGNGWLVLPGADGRVTSFQQFFGNLTPQPPTPQPNGFLALAVYDLPANGGNADGLISGQDAIWKDLRVWVDANHDGVSQPNELLTMAQAGIFWISLDYVDTPHVDEWGNLYRLRGTVYDQNHFLPRDAIWDVWLQ